MPRITTPDPANLITTTEAMERYGVSDRTIRNWFADGLITKYRIGARSVRVDTKEADRALIRRARVRGTDEVAEIQNFDETIAARREALTASKAVSA